MGTHYETDVVAWANEQAALLRAGKLSQIDIENIAEEIEDVGKSEKRELASRMAVLLAHLLKWKFQPTHQGKSWELTIKGQRELIQRRLKKTPSLKASLSDPEWFEDTWFDARSDASKETGIGLEIFPTSCIWTAEQILDTEYYPD
ncbi:DUF29 domain-containing protein [Photorhabdus khanii]|uniref:DUF29 domain-containing protein n=3 Tax=Photorhabdus khanii TaxID=1004150 RepID=A0A4R4JVM4_9GAMM|nr:DUF29 domain-containing protein [Photorhabdus khanii]ETS32246.1 protein of unknown function DUF29 [Photorhabdus khanii NC19]MQL48307.1 DUF29 family protein [Photorhabdus khanii]OHV55175.1 hypothetical protein BB987_08265 [Photorhabdus temperata]TDB58116.1 DUF29 domain-containing protein [Photorhabdus khanii subsp. guanajuatensis]